MKLGAFSISLAVKNLKVSRDFYEKLGFKKFGGDEEQNYLIMKNGDSLIGLFEGMFDQNIITFNPGWDVNANELDQFDDVRKITADLKSKGVTIEKEHIEGDEGPANIVLIDPDGNPVLIDQHV
jgi:catechol 2,3-dioxygenase-like lactoylglutathione lyase family enzyme